jgi:hypothetical protein
MKYWKGSAAILLVLAAPALAAEPGKPGMAAASAQAFGGAASITNDELGAITGEADINMQVRAQNTSTVSNNSVNGNSVTGAIGFDNSAFENLSGLSVVSANTGNNVSINSSLNVNVALNP